MMLTKEEFVSVINDMMATDDFNRSFNKTVLSFGGDGKSYFPNCGVGLLKTLQKMFNDGYDWIPYFCIDKDYGRKDLYCSEKLNTAEDLYDLLVRNYRKRELIEVC